MIEQLFCWNCQYVMGGAKFCHACGQQRQRSAVGLGEAERAPLMLGAVVDGRMVQAQRRIWYATVAEERDSAGSLLQIDQLAAHVERHSLAQWMPSGVPSVRSLATDGKLIYVAALDYALAREPKAVIALEPVTGQVVWQVPLASRELTTPLLYGQSLIVAGGSPGTLSQIALENQAILWQRQIEANLLTQPVSCSDTVVVLTGSLMRRERTVVGVRIGSENGVAWQFEAKDILQPSTDSQRVYIPHRSGVIALDGRHGKRLWHYSEGYRRVTAPATAAVTSMGEVVLIPVAAGTGYAPQYALDAVDGETGKRRWRFVLPLPERTAGHILVSPTVFDDVVVIGDRQGTIYALNIADGSVIWQHRCATRLAAQPFVLGNVLYAPTRDGNLHQLRWREQIWPSESGETLRQRGEFEQAAVAFAIQEPPDWSAAGNCLLQLGDGTHALKVFEQANDVVGMARAAALLGDYERAVTLVQDVSNPPDELERWHEILGQRRAIVFERQAQGETHPVHRAKLWEDAGDIHVRWEQWEEALRCYRAGDVRPKIAHMLARQGRFADAAELMTRLDEPYPKLAGRYYREEAQRLTDLIPGSHTNKRNVPVAKLYEQAATWYRIGSDVTMWRHCLAQVDFWQLRPHLVVTGGFLDAPFQQGAVSVVRLTVENRGVFSAENVSILVEGAARPTVGHIRPIDLLGKGGTTTLSVPIEPHHYGAEGAQLGFEFVLTYQEPLTQTALTSNPFEMFEPVAMNGVEMAVKTGVPVQIFMKGSNVSMGDQVNVNRRKT